LKRPPPPPPLEQEEDERSKRRNVEREDEEEDEDWLRYSPPPPVPEVVVAEKTISRFASEIHGDCVAVTAPSGERVYAKLAVEGLVGKGISGTRQGAHFSNPNPNHKGQLLVLSDLFPSEIRMQLTWFVHGSFCLFLLCCASAGLLSESFHSLTRRAEQEALAKVYT
jgi:chromosome transmission fidelity protein 18